MTSVPNDEQTLETLANVHADAFCYVFRPLPRIVRDLILKDEPAYDRLWPLALDVYFALNRTERAKAIERLYPVLLEILHEWQACGWLPDQVETAPADPPRRPKRRPSPKRLAKWEAQWQAESEAES